MAEGLILAIDQGTTGTTALVIDSALQVKGRSTHEFPQHYPEPGQVEHDLEELWLSTLRAMRGALEDAGARPESIAAIGITNQRETTALWDRSTGAPAARAIVWQDRRTSGRCRELREAGKEEWLREKTGLVADPYFSATKLEWMLAHLPGIREKASRGELAFGTMDSFLLYRLSGGEVHATDVSNASRTLLMDLRSLRWDDELLELFSVPAGLLPSIRASSEILGRTRSVPGLPDGIPIAGMAGDQQAALFGQACFDVGDSKCTYGTGAFLLMNVGERPVSSRAGLLGTVGWKLGDGELAYALEGASFVAGAAVQWVRDGLGLIEKASDIGPLASSVEDSGGVVFVPALAGLGAPHWRPEARGLLTGIDQGTTRAHLARAILEGIALEIRDLAVAMEQDVGRKMGSFTVDGGASASDELMQIQANLLGIPVVRPQMIETTALGAAFLAGLAVGLWSSKEAIRKGWREDRRFLPAMEASVREALVERWRVAVAKA